MLPTLKAAFARFRPDLVVREPCEYASAVVAEQRGVRHVQVAIGLAEVEAASLELAAPVLRTFHPDLPERLLAAPYLTRLPAAVQLAVSITDQQSSTRRLVRSCAHRLTMGNSLRVPQADPSAALRRDVEEIQARHLLRRPIRFRRTDPADSGAWSRRRS